MNATKVGNDIMESGKPSYHVCARCIAFYGDGEYKFLGEVGCYMPNVNLSNMHLYKEWAVKTDNGEVAEFKRCLRCFINNQECVAVSIWPAMWSSGLF